MIVSLLVFGLLIAVTFCICEAYDHGKREGYKEAARWLDEAERQLNGKD